MLRKNQIDAIEKSKNNNFDSGIHFHATGSGKSIIALNIILEYQKQSKKNILVFWITERKSILIEQFSDKKLKESGYYNINDNFLILNYSNYKNKKWYDCVNSSKSWGKSRLVIINRAFLTSSEAYKNIIDNIDLIIHDECHSISNNTTQQFYNHILDKNKCISCIGFTATPVLEYKPYDNIISSYSIYSAIKDNIILPPKIYWLKSENIIDYNEILELISNLIENLPYKKIIIWTGMIKLCYELANNWAEYFKDYKICIDTSYDSSSSSKNKVNTEKSFLNYKDFENIDNNAFLFCAAKHREGSDIRNLDGCIFLDYVEDRYKQTFIQSIGRVLRIDSNLKKKEGLIIDINAKSSINIINKVNTYLNVPDYIFPWKYNYNLININDKQVFLNKLELIVRDDKDISNNLLNISSPHYTRVHLIEKFIRKLPEKEEYCDRLEKELTMFENKNLINHILKALEILEKTGNMIHVTRGSCGSSLVCYLLGISHVDPVKYNIKFSRFLNTYRDTLPDIDFDFSHKLRDEIFLKLHINYPGKIARISNHIYFHEKSAKREAIRKSGYHKFIPKYKVDEEIKTFDKEVQKYIKEETEKLEDTFRGYSLHCGGVVYFEEGVPEHLKLNSKNNSLSQVILNKEDISKDKKFKIDILSSRGVSQLYEIYGYNIDFENTPYDEKTYKLLCTGDNIGLTLGESPLIRKAFFKIQPKSIKDIALCLAVIRPAAKEANKEIIDIDKNRRKNIIYDDDAIVIIMKILNCDECEADKYRRAFSKNNKDIIKEFKSKIRDKSNELQCKIIKKLNSLRSYSFCKSHSYSYAQLIYHLAFAKAHYPEKFWSATLRNACSSYRKWVHIYEAKLNGIEYTNIDKGKNQSIYSKKRNEKIFDMSIDKQIQNFGYWICDKTDFYPNGKSYHIISNTLHNFRGLVASYRYISNTKTMILFICTDKKKYLEIIIEKAYKIKDNFIGIKGSGEMIDKSTQTIICKKYEFF